MTELVFDIGMYDAQDTAYYLESGFEVVAIEANPALCEMATQRLSKFVDAGQLVIRNVAISNAPGEIELYVCGQDLGSSSIDAARLSGRFPLGTFKVPTTTIPALQREYGKPEFVKIDIEGADRECVMSFTAENAPAYLSFEADDEIEQMIEYVHAIGYRGFKIINQNTFRAVHRQRRLVDRVKWKALRLMGFGSPRMVRRAGRLFTLEHSAGPAPWESDGEFFSREQIIDLWRAAKRAGRTGGWYDVHAQRNAYQAEIE